MDSSAQQGGRLCCFGTILGLSVENARFEAPFDGRVVLEDDSDAILVTAHGKTPFGRLNARAEKIVGALRKDLELHFHVESSVDTNAPPYPEARSRKRRGEGNLSYTVNLSATLYGPEKFFEDVGRFVARCGMYLQHPRYCELDLLYRNPHCFEPLEGYMNTSEFIKNAEHGELLYGNSSQNPIDLFADFKNHDSLSEAMQPTKLSTILYRHQKQALTFMLNREVGWAMNAEQQDDVWKEDILANGQHIYTNTITGSQQRKPPKPFRGGLLIDAPGLGKSLSVLSLIALDTETQTAIGENECQPMSTLLIVPKTVIHVWKQELSKHFQSQDTIHHIVYYGKQRTKQLQKKKADDLVVTTYSVVRLDWKASKAKGDDLSQNLFGHKWRRIVLDEAHVIRDPSKNLARSVCDLDAERRWAVTGTPIQNRLTDLFSLFKFLRCYPFDDREIFNRHVTQSWKRHDPTSIARLRLLVNCLSLRRPKSTIDLPLSFHYEKRLDFKEKEKHDHDQMTASTKAKLYALGSTNNGTSFYNTLKWINELRLICNHGPRHMMEMDQQPSPWNQDEAQRRFDRLEQSGLAKCSKFGCGQEFSSVMANEEDNVQDDDPWMSESSMIWCPACYKDLKQSNEVLFQVCRHTPRHSKQMAMGPEQTFTPSIDLDSSQVLPTKLETLVQDLSDSPEGVKSVVFSAWTKTFDLLKPRLTSRSIRSVRLDGSLSTNERTRILHVFHSNPHITVLLATITCGGVGLDLTAASRAYIVEPQWNPMSETQALDRIHRLGQTKEVTTIKYIMRDSFEENVLKLQTKKKELADLTVNGRKLSREDIGASRLAWLRELVG